MLFGVALVGAVGLGALAGFVLILNIAVGLTLTDQPAALTFPETLQVEANVTNALDVVLAGDIQATVPFRQTLRLPLQGRYRTDLDLQTPVELDLDIVYDGLIPVDTFAEISARAPFNFDNVRTFRGIVFDAQLPMKLQVPVRFEVPVKETIDFRYKGRVMVTMDSVVDAPIDTVIPATLAVNEDVTTPLAASFGMKMVMPRTPQRVVIDHADLRMPLRSLRLEQKTEGEGPERHASPWGPAAPAR